METTFSLRPTDRCTTPSYNGSRGHNKVRCWLRDWSPPAGYLKTLWDFHGVGYSGGELELVPLPARFQRQGAGLPLIDDQGLANGRPKAHPPTTGILTHEAMVRVPVQAPLLLPGSIITRSSGASRTLLIAWTKAVTILSPGQHRMVRPSPASARNTTLPVVLRFHSTAAKGPVFSN